MNKQLQPLSFLFSPRDLDPNSRKAKVRMAAWGGMAAQGPESWAPTGNPGPVVLGLPLDMCVHTCTGRPQGIRCVHDAVSMSYACAHKGGAPVCVCIYRCV